MPGNRCWCGGVAVRGVCADGPFHDPEATGRPAKIETLYIAGPMTGYPDSNYPAFREAAAQLEAVGFKTVNPADFGEDGAHYTDFIREDLRVLLDCHGVAVLENWWESTGARNEVAVAGILKMPVRPAEEWVHRAQTIARLAEASQPGGI